MCECVCVSVDKHTPHSFPRATNTHLLVILPLLLCHLPLSFLPLLPQLLLLPTVLLLLPRQQKGHKASVNRKTSGGCVCRVDTLDTCAFIWSFLSLSFRSALQGPKSNRREQKQPGQTEAEHAEAADFLHNSQPKLSSLINNDSSVRRRTSCVGSRAAGHNLKIKMKETQAKRDADSTGEATST